MTKQLVLDYLTIHGEKINAEIKIGLPAKSVSGLLVALNNLNKVTRRQVHHNGKIVWCYRAASTGTTEPDYAFILRNLPR
jgi:hypothetical protein